MRGQDGIITGVTKGADLGMTAVHLELAQTSPRSLVFHPFLSTSNTLGFLHAFHPRSASRASFCLARLARYQLTIYA